MIFISYFLGRFICSYNFVEMAKANSFKSEPWTQLEKGSYSIFDDDFISDKLVFKTTKKSSTSTVALKESFHISKEGKINKSDEELKFWFPFRDTHNLYFRLKNESYKVHYDGGVQENNGYKLNFYASAQGKRSFSGDSYKVGVQVKKNDWSSNFRAAFKPIDLGFTLYNRTLIAINKLNFGLVNVLDVSQKNWLHSALQIGWQDNSGNDYYLRTNSGKKYEKVNPSSYLANLTANYIYKYNPNNSLGLQVKANLANLEFGNAAFVWDHKCESSADTGIKLKADINRNLGVSIKNPISGFGSYIFGVNVSDFGGANKFTYGVQLDLNL